MSSSDSPPATGGEATPIKIPSETETEQVETPDPISISDPLLGSGSFIDPTNGVGAEANHKTPSKEKNPPPAAAAAPAAGGDNSDALLQKRARPDWLPDNFEMILRTRTSGATEGTIDRYYISPGGHRLRSKNEVINFLETGSKKKKKPAANSDDATSEGSAPPSKKKKTGARKKVKAAFTFDFKNPPEKVSWCLNYATEDVWSPSMGDWNIPLATKQEWAAVFNHVCQN